MNVMKYLKWAMSVLHLCPPLKRVALRIIVRAIVDDEDHAALVDRAVQLSRSLAPSLNKYYIDAGLRVTLTSIAAPAGAAPGAVVEQGQFVPFMSSDLGVHVAVALKSCGLPSAGRYLRMAMTTLMVLIGHFLSPGFEALFNSLPAGFGSPRKVPVKATSRMGTKGPEHEEIELKHKLMPGSLNLDTIRIGITSESAEQQLNVWAFVQNTFPEILRVKNLFVDDTLVGASGLRYILVNVLYEPGITYAQMMSSPEWHQAVKNAVAAADDGIDDYDEFVAAFRLLLPLIGKMPVRMAAEVQLHLERHVEARKQTHFWFKIERSENAAALFRDCYKYMDAT